MDQIHISFDKHNWNVAISRMIDLVNELNKYDYIDVDIWKNYIKMLAPFAPFISEELWNCLGEKFSVHSERYPQKYMVSNEVKKCEIIVTINGKKRGKFVVTKISKKVIIEKAIFIASKYGVNKESKYKYINGKLVNFILKK